MTRQTRKTPAERTPQQPPKADAQPAAGSQPWLGWAAVILVAVVVLIGVAIGVERLNDGDPVAGAEVQITPIVGGMAVPTATQNGSGEPMVTVTQNQAMTSTEAAGESEAMSPAAALQTNRTTALAVPAEAVTGGMGLVFEPGAMVRNNAGDVVIYAEPSLEAQILDTYAPGISLTVIEPGGDFAGYPVEVDGSRWVRVRAEDGLAGWTLATGLALEN